MKLEPFLILALLAGCSAPSGTTRAASADRPQPRVGSPLSQAERRTTSGAIALRNLQAQISELERQPKSLRVYASLVDLLLTRAVVLGQLADYERVAALGEEAVRSDPNAADAYALRARARAALHDFQGALSDLDEAARRGVPRRRIDDLRAEALKELGRPEEALEMRRRLAAERRDLFTLAAEAIALGEHGEVEKAERLFTEAQNAYRDVSPFPFAWLYFCQGLMWEKAANADRARDFYRAALERLPGYPPAASHLAALEAAARHENEAIALLRPLVGSSDDPEYAGQLSALLRAEGEAAEADRLRASAAERFDDLVAKRPAAFAAKAATFWLGPGGDAEKAVRLAELNLSARQTPEDLKLLADARAARLADARAALGGG